MQASSDLDLTIENVASPQDVAKLAAIADKGGLLLNVKGYSEYPSGIGYEVTLTAVDSNEPLPVHIGRAILVHAALQGLTPEQAVAQVQTFLSNHGVGWDEPA